MKRANVEGYNPELQYDQRINYKILFFIKKPEHSKIGS